MGVKQVLKPFQVSFFLKIGLANMKKTSFEVFLLIAIFKTPSPSFGSKTKKFSLDYRLDENICVRTMKEEKNMLCVGKTGTGRHTFGTCVKQCDR